LKSSGGDQENWGSKRGAERARRLPGAQAGGEQLTSGKEGGFLKKTLKKKHILNFRGNKEAADDGKAKGSGKKVRQEWNTCGGGLDKGWEVVQIDQPSGNHASSSKEGGGLEASMGRTMVCRNLQGRLPLQRGSLKPGVRTARKKWE